MAHRRLRGTTIMDNLQAASASLGGVALAAAATPVAFHNATGGTLSIGDLVYLSGWDATSGLFTATKADADAGGKQARLVVTTAALNGANGVAGHTLDLTAQNTNAGNVGDPVYLHTTAGAYTLTAPSAVNAIQQIVGYIAVKSATVGEIQFNLLNALPLVKIGSNEHQPGSVLEAALDPAVSLGLVVGRVCHSVYDFATDAGVSGTLPLRGGTIPDKAIVYGGLLNVNTALNSSGGATAALQYNAANDLVTATAFGSSPWSSAGIKAIAPVMTAGSAIKGTAARVPSLVIGTANLTGGHFNLWLFYFVADAAN